MPQRTASRILPEDVDRVMSGVSLATGWPDTDGRVEAERGCFAGLEHTESVSWGGGAQWTLGSAAREELFVSLV